MVLCVARVPLICIIHAIILFTWSASSQFIIGSVTLFPNNSNAHSGSVRLSKHIDEVKAIDNEWSVYIQQQNSWQFILTLDNTWAFHPTLISTVELTISSPSIAEGCCTNPTNPLATFDDIVFGFTTDNVEYFSMWIPFDNAGQKNRIYPSCSTDNAAPQSFVVGDIASLPNQDRSCDVAGGDCLNWNTMFPKNAQVPDVFETNHFPITITLENDPVADILYIYFHSASFSSTFIQKCRFVALPTNRGLKIYIGGNDPGQSFKISSFQVEAWTTAQTTLDPTPSPSNTPSSTPTKTPSDTPTNIPTNIPTNNPSTGVPSTTPTNNPSATPTKKPTMYPTTVPSDAPTLPPSAAPSSSPSTAPTAAPSNAPSFSPTPRPSLNPTLTPTSLPSITPSYGPSNDPSFSPSTAPSASPTPSPSFNPSTQPTKTPTKDPSQIPTTTPTLSPITTLEPTTTPSTNPTLAPIMPPSVTPSLSPTESPIPTKHPTTSIPTENPITHSPTFEPTMNPTLEPTVNPTLNPTATPTTFEPTATPSTHPTSDPTKPTFRPTKRPTLYPNERMPSEPTPRPIYTFYPTTEAPTALPTADPVVHSTEENEPSFAVETTLNELFTTELVDIIKNKKDKDGYITARNILGSAKFGEIILPLTLIVLVGGCALCCVIIVIIRQLCMRFGRKKKPHKYINPVTNHKTDDNDRASRSPLSLSDSIDAQHIHRIHHVHPRRPHLMPDDGQFLTVPLKKNTFCRNLSDHGRDDDMLMDDIIDEMDDSYQKKKKKYHKASTLDLSDSHQTPLASSSDSDDAIMERPGRHNYSTLTLKSGKAIVEELHADIEMAEAQSPKFRKRPYHHITSSGFDRLQSAINEAKTHSDFDKLEELIKKGKIPSPNWHGKGASYRTYTFGSNQETIDEDEEYFPTKRSSESTVPSSESSQSTESSDEPIIRNRLNKKKKLENKVVPLDEDELANKLSSVLKNDRKSKKRRNVMNIMMESEQYVD